MNNSGLLLLRKLQKWHSVAEAPTLALTFGFEFYQRSFTFTQKVTKLKWHYVAEAPMLALTFGFEFGQLKK